MEERINQIEYKVNQILKFLDDYLDPALRNTQTTIQLIHQQTQEIESLKRQLRALKEEVKNIK